MELFTVRNAANKKLGSFDSKPAAKGLRDELGGIEAGVRVSRGADNLASPRPSKKRGWV